MLFYRHPSRWIGLMAGCLSCLSLAVVADSDGPTSETTQPSGFDLSGYGALAYTRDDVDHLGFVRELTQDPGPDETAPWKTDSQFGLQASYRFNRKTDLVALLNLREQKETNVDNRLEWAYLGLHPNDDLDIRVGRIGWDAFLMSDHRHLGFTYPWARPPTEFYGALPTYSLNGADISTQFYGLGDNSPWRLKLQLGTTRTTFPFGTGQYDFEGKTGTLSLTHRIGFWKFRLGYATFQIDNNPQPLADLYSGLDTLAGFGIAEAASLRHEMTYQDSDIDFTTVGFLYDNFDWIAQMELGVINSSARMVTNGHTAYVMVGRQLAKWTPYAGVSVVKPKHDLLSAQTDWGSYNSVRNQAIGIINSTQMDQHTVSVGARWDFHPQADIKLQWDQTRVKANHYGLWRNDHPDFDSTQDTRVNLYTLSLEFIF